MSSAPDHHLGASSFRSVPDLWHHRIGSTPDAVAFRHRVGDAWASMTWEDAGRHVKALATGLLAQGLAAEDRCAILAATCHEWILADLAILCAGGATSTVYPTAPTSDCLFILADSGSRVLFVDTPEQAERIEAERDQLPQLERIVVFHGERRRKGFVVSMQAFQEEGRAWAAKHPEGYTEARKAVGPEHLATVMYTSGTTDRPKGVMLTHDAWLYEAEAIDALDFLTPVDVHYLFLPLSHVFAKVLEMSLIRLGIPTVVDGNVDRFLDNLSEQQPTWLAAVPRIFEKMQDRILADVARQPRHRREVFAWALRIGRRSSAVRQRGRKPTGLLRAKLRLADRLVYRRIRERFGGNLRFMISGGAPLPRETAEFFDALQLLVLEGYGLTESAAASCVNRPGDMRLGTVGKPLPGCEVRIAEDGEIELRSRGVMRGYWQRPDETERVLADDGWLRTGDLGLVRHSGHVEITGRKKELIVTAGGKNIAPAHFEALLRSRCPYVEHAVLHGDRRPFCVALVTLDRKATQAWAAAHGVPDDPERLHEQPAIRELVQDYIDAVNRELPPWEHARRVALLPESFSQDNRMLTPSLKVKRRVVEARYAETLDQLYGG